MQILGKRSKVLLIAVAIIMLITIGVSFAMWDNMSTVKATTGNVAYSTAQVGDIIQYGRYYQTGIKDEATGEYEKTPIDWIVVDKDERIGRLTLMSKYILACGSYFGNNYYNIEGNSVTYNSDLTASVLYNQAYNESTVRAFLNNLERRDLGGDSFIDNEYKPCSLSSTKETGLLTSVGFSNKLHFGGLYKRAMNKNAFINRPMSNGFYDEAFNEEEKAMLVPRCIPGSVAFRWPTNANNIEAKTYIDGTIDKVWIPSAVELGAVSDEYVNSSDNASATTFEYFKNYGLYNNAYDGIKNVSLFHARIAKGTDLLISSNSKVGNFSIPIYKRGSTEINDDIHESKNSSSNYWTRSALSGWFREMRVVIGAGSLNAYATTSSDLGVRPCIILKY